MYLLVPCSHLKQFVFYFSKSESFLLRKGKYKGLLQCVFIIVCNFLYQSPRSFSHFI